MKTIREILQASDPLRHEPARPSDRREFRRQAVLAAASGAYAPAVTGSRSRIAAIALIVIAAALLGSRVLSPFVGSVEAAVRFEIKLAEDRSVPGLREVKIAGSDKSVYLHSEVIVTNSDIAAAQVVQNAGTSQYSVTVEFNASGTEKMLAATKDHVGKPVAILLDGQVVSTPVLRSPIAASAVVDGHYTRAQAERIVNGIAIQ